MTASPESDARALRRLLANGPLDAEARKQAAGRRAS